MRPLPRTDRARCVPYLVLIGHAASLGVRDGVRAGSQLKCGPGVVRMVAAAMRACRQRRMLEEVPAGKGDAVGLATCTQALRATAAARSPQRRVG
jgi:hypothetical protein